MCVFLVSVSNSNGYRLEIEISATFSEHSGVKDPTPELFWGRL